MSSKLQRCDGIFVSVGMSHIRAAFIIHLILILAIILLFYQFFSSYQELKDIFFPPSVLALIISLISSNRARQSTNSFRNPFGRQEANINPTTQTVEDFYSLLGMEQFRLVHTFCSPFYNRSSDLHMLRGPGIYLFTSHRYLYKVCFTCECLCEFNSSALTLHQYKKQNNPSQENFHVFFP